MTQIITIPKLGLTMEKGKITKWLVKEGDPVSRGESLFVLETDKITNDVESPEEAYVIALLAEEGQECDVYAPVCVLGEKGEKYELPDMAGASFGMAQKTMTEIKEVTAFFSIPEDNAIKGSPVARKLAETNGVDIAKVKGTGPEGRINKEDILAYIERETHRKNAKPQRNDIKSGKQPVSGIRRIIAQRMTESKRTIPHVYFKTSVDATNMVRRRKGSGKKYSYNDLIIKAVAEAIYEFPVINALYANDEIELRREINIGIAVNLENGLIVPVIKNARKPLDDISSITSGIIAKAKSNKLLPEDLMGGTFTISNLGMYDIDEFTAIINPGESAILAVSKISDKVFPDQGIIRIRPEINLTLSVDHRLIDGDTAAQFLARLKSFLEKI
jgi:pyruvate dehydrogenase E2 component (dihydrolipoamide acetyltransferase)